MHHLQERLPARKLRLQTAVATSVTPRPLLIPQVLATSEDLKTSACCTAAAPPPLVREALEKVPDEVKAKYYGCGSPLPMGIDGLRCAQGHGRGPGRAVVCPTLRISQVWPGAAAHGGGA